MNSRLLPASKPSLAREIVFQAIFYVTLPVCGLQIFFPVISIPLIDAGLIVNQFQRPAILSRRDLAVIMKLKAFLEILSATGIKVAVAQ